MAAKKPTGSQPQPAAIAQPWAVPGTAAVSSIANKTPEQIQAERDALIGEWFATNAKLAEIKAEELRLRNLIVEIVYGGIDRLAEGVNKVDMPQGWVLKATGKLNRKVLEPELEAHKAELKAAGIKVDNLIKWTPELKTSAYRELTAEQIKVFDQVLDIKPGTPGLELAKPKR